MDDRSLPRLPIELIEAIVDRSDAASQRSFALTCKLLLHRARLNIWRHMTFYELEDLEFLESAPHLIPYTRAMTFQNFTLDEYWFNFLTYLPQLQTLEIENATGLGINFPDVIRGLSSLTSLTRLKLDYVPFDSLVSWHYALSAIPLLNDLSVVDIEFMPDADHTLPPDARHLHLQALEMSYINELDLMSGWVQAVVPIDSLRHLSLSLSYPEDADIASTLFEHFGPSLRSIELVLDRMQADDFNSVTRRLNLRSCAILQSLTFKVGPKSDGSASITWISDVLRTIQTISLRELALHITDHPFDVQLQDTFPILHTLRDPRFQFVGSLTILDDVTFNTKESAVRGLQRLLEMLMLTGAHQIEEKELPGPIRVSLDHMPRNMTRRIFDLHDSQDVQKWSSAEGHFCPGTARDLSRYMIITAETSEEGERLRTVSCLL